MFLLLVFSINSLMATQPSFAEKIQDAFNFSSNKVKSSKPTNIVESINLNANLNQFEFELLFNYPRFTPKAGMLFEYDLNFGQLAESLYFGVEHKQFIHLGTMFSSVSLKFTGSARQGKALSQDLMIYTSFVRKHLFAECSYKINLWRTKSKQIFVNATESANELTVLHPTSLDKIQVHMAAGIKIKADKLMVCVEPINFSFVKVVYDKHIISSKSACLYGYLGVDTMNLKFDVGIQYKFFCKTPNFKQLSQNFYLSHKYYQISKRPKKPGSALPTLGKPPISLGKSRIGVNSKIEVVSLNQVELDIQHGKKPSLDIDNHSMQWLLSLPSNVDFIRVSRTYYIPNMESLFFNYVSKNIKVTKSPSYLAKNLPIALASLIDRFPFLRPNIILLPSYQSDAQTLDILKHFVPTAQTNIYAGYLLLKNSDSEAGHAVTLAVNPNDKMFYIVDTYDPKQYLYNRSSFAFHANNLPVWKDKSKHYYGHLSSCLDQLQELLPTYQYHFVNFTQQQNKDCLCHAFANTFSIASGLLSFYNLLNYQFTRDILAVNKYYSSLI